MSDVKGELELAAFIRDIDGNNEMGASKLAEKILAWQAARSQGDAEPARDRVRDALAEALCDAMDCTRVWEAWSVGTMGPEDFVVITEDDERLEELVDAAMSALSGVNCKSCGDFGSDCDVCGHGNDAAPSPEVLAETLANDLFEVGREPDREVYRIQFMAGDLYEEKGCGGLDKKALTRWLTGRLGSLLSTNATPPRPEWVKCSKQLQREIAEAFYEGDSADHWNVLRDLVEEAGLKDPNPPEQERTCKGRSCTSVDGTGHSEECIADHKAAYSNPPEQGGE